MNVLENSRPDHSLTATADTACFGESVTVTSTINPLFTADPSGGYSYDGGATFVNSSSFSFTKSSFGDTTVTVSVRDDNGCLSTPSESISIYTSDVVDYSVNILQSPDCGGTVGEFSVKDFSGGISPYFTSLNGGTATSVLATDSVTYSGLTPGSYLVHVEDKFGCSAIDTTINFPSSISFDTTIVDVLCYGDSTGSIEVSNTTGGTAPYTFALNDTNTLGAATLFSNLPAANHTLYIKDSDGCLLSIAIEIEESDSLFIQEDVHTDISCSVSEGELTLSAQGGTGPSYTMAMLGEGFQVGAGPFTFSNLSAGTYPVGLQDNVGCTASDTFEIISAPTLAVIVTPLTDATCNQNNGSAEVTSITGGSGNYLYMLVGESGYVDSATLHNDFIDSLSGGTHQIIVQDVTFSCFDTTSFVINVPGGIDLASIVEDNQTPGCSGLDGFIGLSNINGLAPFAFQLENTSSVVITPFQSDSSFSNLTSGDYVIVIRDGNLCELDYNFTIAPSNPFQEINSGLALNKSICNGDSVLLQAMGGVTYTWNPTSTLTAVNDSTQYAKPASDQMYTVEITSAEGCIDTDSVQVTVIPIATGTVSSSSDSLCFGDNVIVTASLDASYTENPAGSYSFDNGVTFSADSTFSFTLSGSGDTTVQVIFRDALDCGKYDTVSTIIHQLAPVSFDLDITRYPTCSVANGDFELSAFNGGVSPYDVTVNASTFNDETNASVLPFLNQSSGTYAINITDDFGCTTDTSFIFQNSISFDTSTAAPLCFGDPTGEIELSNIAGGTSPYVLSINDTNSYSSDTLFTGLESATYSIFIKDATNCTVEALISINEPDSLFLNEDAVVDASCISTTGDITVSATGGTAPFDVNLNGTIQSGSGPFTITGIAPSTDTIFISDANGCSNQLEFTINSSPSITSFVSQTQEATCNSANGKAVIDSTINGSGDYSYNLSSFTGFVDSLTVHTAMDTLRSGSYVLISFDNVLSCSDTIVFNITEPDAVDMNAILIDSINPGCTGVDGEISVSNIIGDSPYDFRLVDNSDASIVVDFQADSSFTGLSYGDYNFVIRDANLCNTSFDVVLDSGSVLVDINTGLPNEVFICSGDSITLQASGATTYSWSPTTDLTNVNDSTQIAKPSSTTLYILTATNEDGCIDEDSVNVIVSPISTGTVVASSDSVCFGESVTVKATLAPSLTPNTGGSYSFDNGVTFTNTDSITFTMNSTGDTTVSVIFRDSLDCGKYDTISVVVHQLAPVSYVLDIIETPSCTGDPGEFEIHTIAGGVANYTVSVNTSPFVSDGSDTLTFTNQLAGTYNLDITDAFGCTTDTSFVFSTAFAFDTIIQNPSCFGDLNGIVQLSNITGGTSPYEFSISDTNSYQTDSTFTGIGAGTVSIFVKDASGCVSENLVDVSQPDSLELLNINQINESCTGGLGSLDVEVVGGNSSFDINLNTDIQFGSTRNYTFSNLNAGNDTVFVIDERGCTAFLPINILDETIITTYTTQTATPTGCTVADGAIQIDSVVGHVGSYTLSLNNGVFMDSLSIQPDLNALSIGSHTLVVQDSLGCTDTNIFIITSPATGLESDSVKENTMPPGCLGNDGTLALSNLQGAAPFEFALLDDANGTLVGFQPDSSFANLNSGDYTIVVKDTGECLYNFPLTVGPSTNYKSLITSISSDKTICPNDTIELNVTHTGITQEWSGDLTIDDTSSDNTFATPLTSTSYLVKVTDTEGCQDSSFVNASILALPTGTLVSNTLNACYGSTVTLTAQLDSGYFETPGGTYSFDGGATFSDVNVYTFSTETIGDTTVTVIFDDLNGCAVSDPVSLIISNLDTLDLVVDIITSPDCGGTLGELEFNSFSGGLSPYEVIFNGDTNRDVVSTDIINYNNLFPGNYIVTMVDSAGCSTNKSINLLNSIGFDQTLIEPTCYGDPTGQITISNVTGGTAPYEYSYNDTASSSFSNDTIFENLTGGIHSIYIKDATDCLIPVAVNLPQPDSLYLQVLAQSDVNCAGDLGSIQVQPMGGTPSYFVSFRNSSSNVTTDITFNNIEAGIDTMYVVDAFSCIDTLEVNIGASPSIEAYLTQTAQPTGCNTNDGGAIIDSIIGGSGNFEYSLDNGTPFKDSAQIAVDLGMLMSGQQSLIINDLSLGCTDTTLFSIQAADGIFVDSINVTVNDPSCVEVDARIELSNIFGAPEPYTYALYDDILDTMIVDFQDVAIFKGGGNVIDYEISEGQYFVRIQDNLGCIYDVDSIIVNEAVDMQTLGTPSDASCGNDNGEITISVTGGISPYTYVLRDSGSQAVVATQQDSIFADLAVGIYEFSVTDSSDPECNAGHGGITIGTNSVDLQFAIDSVSCFGLEDGSLRIDSVLNPDTTLYSYQYSFGDTLNFVNADEIDTNNLDAGFYKVYIQQTTKSSGTICTYADRETFYLEELGDTITADSIPVFEPDSINSSYYAVSSDRDNPDGILWIHSITGGNAPYQISMDSIDFFTYNSVDTLLNEFGDLNVGEYDYYVRDSKGCAEEFTALIGSKFYVPNIFTPNGDGDNDVFYIEALPEGSRLTVYDRWGVMAYQKFHYGNDWDGGKLPEGTYFYELKTKYELVKGWVEILR